MTVPNCDILVVGAGPAGSSAALAAARQGVNVLLVERRRQVGMPVQCAEYIPAMLKGQLGLKGGFVVQKIEGMHTFVPGHVVKKTAARKCGRGEKRNSNRFQHSYCLWHKDFLFANAVVLAKFTIC